MTKAIIYSKQVLLLAKKAAGNYAPLCCGTEVSPTFTPGIIATSTKGSGNYETYEYSKKIGWSLNFSGVQLLRDITSNAWTLPELEAVLFAFEKILIKIISTDTDGNVYERSGTVLIKTFGQTATVGDGGDKATYTLELQGSGPLERAFYPVTGFIINENETYANGLPLFIN